MDVTFRIESWVALAELYRYEIVVGTETGVINLEFNSFWLIDFYLPLWFVQSYKKCTNSKIQKVILVHTEAKERLYINNVPMLSRDFSKLWAWIVNRIAR